MKLLDLLKTASSNMLRSKARTFLTIIAIFIGAMTITLTNGIGTGIKSYLNRQIGNLGATNILTVQITDKNASFGGAPTKYDPNQKTVAGSRADGSQLLISSKDIDKIKSTANISDVSPVQAISPDYIEGKNDVKYQLSVQQQFGATTADMLAGKGVDNSSASNQISIPENYIKVLGFNSSQDAVGKSVAIAISDGESRQTRVKATIAGIQQKSIIGGGLLAFANKSLATQLHNIQSIGLPKAAANSFFYAAATFPSNLTTAQVTSLKDDLKAKGYTSLTIKDKQDIIFTVIDSIIIVFDMFGAIALLAATFGIINTLFMAVQERTKEIGLMKALGMSPKRIFTLFSIEAILLGFWGSVLGVGFAALLGNVIDAVASSSFLKDFPGLKLLTFPPSTIITVIAGIMLIAFLAGTLPAFRASRKDPIEALRYE
jgi:putative ABC transport system permease protein